MRQLLTWTASRRSRLVVQPLLQHRPFLLARSQLSLAVLAVSLTSAVAQPSTYYNLLPMVLRHGGRRLHFLNIFIEVRTVVQSEIYVLLRDFRLPPEQLTIY